jgi:methyltransferase
MLPAPDAIAVLALVFVPMLIEAARASRNERRQRARGGLEPPDDVYGVMRLAYPAVFLAMIGEGIWRQAALPHVSSSPFTSPVTLWGVALFVAGKALKWWAIVSLGRAWTFRVIVVPGDVPVTAGPYAWLRHPNYLGVVGELVGVALMTGARIVGPLGTLAFSVLMAKRIAVEERALERTTP